ncbi:hypothetical protein L484_024008 [Morus notabilis]|uniref:Protein NDH-DEPENDENT CYCLIC ELECTRON FLOW 5 n=1 Tax=Morus notabilis TaxID=981085 RepID=W9RNZ1_9ROSA|nr:protein NDH-DEPENDENT CYCLIC ELECTRON FLOW 5 [Morus notabilis]EXB62710.1 hypothetical protein L484_024008 [Morus notabilis]
MAMALNPLFIPNPISFSTTKTIITNNTFPSSKNSIFHCKTNDSKKEVVLPRVASIPYQPINVDYLQEEFSGHGVTFQGIGDGCVAKMRLENGSTAILMLPSGLITSYKAAMWHGGTDEMLHSFVTEEIGGAVVHGGVSLALEFSCGDGVSWSPSNWVLQTIKGNSQDSIQVELISTDSGEKVEIKYIVTLKEDELSSDLVISNSRSTPVQLTGCVLSHLRVSSPEATYAIGLERSNFFSLPPFMSNFGIVPPDFGQENESGFSQLLNKMSFWRSRNGNNADETKSDGNESKEEMEGEETDNYKNLREEMSRIYTIAPRNMTLIDRGRRNSVIVGRKGFDELYMLSPGSSHEIYGKYSYISVGQSAMLKPLNVRTEEVLRVGQDLYNPNL